MSTEKAAIPAVFAAIAQVKLEIDDLGISKDSKSTQGGGYKYRGIDAVLDAFSGPLAKAKLLVIPSYSDILRDRTPTNNGSVVMVQVTGTYRCVSLEDGSEVTWGPFYGEATDSLDKATSKAMSVCLRNAYLQTFTCPLGPSADTEDGDEPIGVDTDKSDAKDAGKGESAKAPASTKGKGKAAAKGKGKASLSLTGTQLNVFTIKLNRAGMTVEDALAKFGDISSANVTAVVEQLEEIAAKRGI